MLKLQQFIKDHPQDFRELLIEKPYAIKIVEDEHFMLFKYSQINSDFTNELVRECRGIILDKVDWSVACHPFHKFGNYGESYVPEIDWKSASTQEKKDGSLIKAWWNKYENYWQISTNGTIDAKTAELQFTNGYGIASFYDLVIFTLNRMDQRHITHSMIKEFTYLFELCTPLNKVVVPHKDYKLYHLATKNNETGREIELILGLIPKPLRYPLTTLDECVASANELPFSEEGYVIVDKDLNRVKIKGLKYLQVHRLKGEGQFTQKRALDIVRMNEQSEVLVYYPEFIPVFEEITILFNIFIQKVEEDLVNCSLYLMKDRKTFASWVNKNCILPSSCFSFYDGKITTTSQAIKRVSTDNLLKYIKKDIN